MLNFVFLLAVLAVVASCNTPCSFVVDGNSYDLSPLNKRDLVWKQPYSQTQWFLRVCSPVSNCGSSKNAAICEEDDNRNHHSGGRFDKATAKPLDEKEQDGLSIIYTDGDVGCGDVTRSTTVQCFCDESEEGQIRDVSEYPPCTMKMVVNSKHCCPKSDENKCVQESDGKTVCTAHIEAAVHDIYRIKSKVDVIFQYDAESSEGTVIAFVNDKKQRTHDIEIVEERHFCFFYLGASYCIDFVGGFVGEKCVTIEEVSVEVHFVIDLGYFVMGEVELGDCDHREHF
ncbi:hypothetical protein GEMRC1_004943 [Eukaryota sp. GEM-RC1]